MLRRMAVVGTLLFALMLGAPRPSDAGILEIIWEMSGPQMLGVGYGCLYSLKGERQCRIGSGFFKGLAQERTKGPGPYLGFTGIIYGSTGKDSATQQYDWWEVGMVALEPVIAFRSYECGTDVQVHHGVGISYDILFGRDIPTFDKFAFTVTAIDVTIKRVAVGVKFRLYPNGFTDDEFKPGPRLNMNRPFETTVGFTFNVILDSKP